MKLSSLLKALSFNFAIGILIYLIWLDVVNRSAYASGLGFVPSITYSFFTHIFIMKGENASLISPLTLDWMQILLTVLVAYDSAYIIRLLIDRRRKRDAKRTT